MMSKEKLDNIIVKPYSKSKSNKVLQKRRIWAWAYTKITNLAIYNALSRSRSGTVTTPPPTPGAWCLTPA